MGRNHEIDGLRGWAAFIVILFHFFRETFGKTYPYLHKHLIDFILNGPLMVLIFFILSGDALSYSFFSTGKTDTTVRLAVARYFRLTFPILVSCLLIWLAMRMELVFNIEASTVVHRKDWLGAYLNFQPSLRDALQYSFNGAYFGNSAEHSYNPFLWTMPIELLGSLIIFINIFILHRQKNVLLILIPQAVFFFYFSEYYFLFITGMILGYLRSINVFETLRAIKPNWIFLVLFILLTFVVLNFYPYQAEAVFKMITFGQIHTDVRFVFAVAIVFLCYSSNALAGFFSSRFSKFLGDISFPLYVFQFNILVTITSYMILYFNKKDLLVNGSYWLIIPIVSILATIGVATAFRMVERKYLLIVNFLIARNIIED